VINVFDHKHTGDFYFVNNTIIGVDNGFVGFDDTCAQQAIVRNNAWYDVTNPVFPTAGVTSLTWTHNAYFDAPSEDPDPNKQVGGSNPFVNWAAYDFAPAAPTAPGVSLPAPFNMDWSGKIRGSDGNWDRGALEFVGSPPSPPSAPTNLRIVP
jgi:hypothetical protein